MAASLVTPDLFGLPFELRSHIYCSVIEECLARPLPLPHADLQCSRLETYWALLKTNRQIHDELEALFFKTYSDRVTLLSHHGGLSALVVSIASAPDKIVQNGHFHLRCPSRFQDFRLLGGCDSEKALRLEHRFIAAMLKDQKVFPDPITGGKMIANTETGYDGYRCKWRDPRKTWLGRHG